jgi:tetratricopeptide (TPR) repeat protein
LQKKKQHKYNPSVNNLFQRSNLKLFIPILIVAVVGSVIAFVVLSTSTTTSPRPQNEASELYGKGLALKNLGNYIEAIQYYDKTLAIDPNYKDALYEKGWTLNELERYEEAVTYFESTSCRS